MSGMPIVDWAAYNRALQKNLIVSLKEPTVAVLEFARPEVRSYWKGSVACDRFPSRIRPWQAIENRSTKLPRILPNGGAE
jgi:hypothetical protein